MYFFFLVMNVEACLTSILQVFLQVSVMLCLFFILFDTLLLATFISNMGRMMAFEDRMLHYYFYFYFSLPIFLTEILNLYP